MLAPVLLWRDHTAAALDTLIKTIDANPIPAALSTAVEAAREVLHIDPDKAYGFAGPLPDIRAGSDSVWLARATSRIARQRFEEGEQARRERDEARSLVEQATRLASTRADRLAAAQAEVEYRGRRIDELRDALAEVRRQRDKAEQIVSERGKALDRAEAESTWWKTRLVDETARLRAKLTRTRATRPRIWWPGDEQPENLTRVITGTNRDEARLDSDGLWRDPDAPAGAAPGATWDELLSDEGPVVEVIDHAAEAHATAILNDSTRSAAGIPRPVATGGIIPAGNVVQVGTAGCTLGC